MTGFQKRGVESSADLVPIHPGLAKWMREKGVWNSKWESKIARAVSLLYPTSARGTAAPRPPGICARNTLSVIEIMA